MLAYTKTGNSAKWEGVLLVFRIARSHLITAQPPRDGHSAVVHIKELTPLHRRAYIWSQDCRGKNTASYGKGEKTSQTGVYHGERQMWNNAHGALTKQQQ